MYRTPGLSFLQSHSILTLSILTASLSELENCILQFQNKLSGSPRTDPCRSTYLANLAEARLARYHLSDEKDDLERSIAHSAEAILLLYHPLVRHDPNIITTFFFFSDALLRLSQKFNQLGYAKHCVKHFRYLRDQSLETSRITRGHITTGFAWALATQVQLESIDPMGSIGDMAVLCCELLSLDVPEELLIGAVKALLKFISVQPVSISLPDQAIEFLREARTRFPDLEEVPVRLVFALHDRYLLAHSDADYEEAMSVLEGSVERRDVELALNLAGSLARARFFYSMNPEYLEEALFRTRAHLRAMSSDSEDPQRHLIAQSLALLEKLRLYEYSDTVNPPSADSNIIGTNYPSFFHLEPFPMTKSDSGRFPTATQDEEHQDSHIEGLGSLLCLLHVTDDLAAIEEAIENCRRCLTLSRSSDAYAFLYATLLAEFLLNAFRSTDNVKYLNESITVRYDILKMPGLQIARLNIIQPLILCLFTRFVRFDGTDDLNEIMRLFPIAATDTGARIPDRFAVSCEWAFFARLTLHSSPSAAYESAISLIQDSLSFAPTLEIQHLRLVSKHNTDETLPLDYASYQVGLGQLEQAVETLERGRGLLWSEMRGLRMSIDQLRLVNLPLAERFATINNDLEALTTSSSAGIWPTEGQADSDELMDSFGRLVIRQRILVAERDGLISQIQSLPGFETFLRPTSFDVLRSAAERGPVVIINQTKWRSDIIILTRDSPPSLIPTPDNLYERANQLKDQLLSARDHGLESGAYDDALSSVLETLHDLVGRPVIQRLHELNIPEQSRIWFCPTSVFCSLPLHAMGPIRSEGSVKSYFSDLYIPSYTPTLSALIESRKPRARPLDRPSMLLVIQPDAKMPKALQEMRVIQSIGPSTATLIWETATPSAVLEHLRDYQFVHVSSHGNLETGKPFDAFFKLYEGARLTLLDIVRSRLPTGEFAFLSACHTAELTRESIADEGLHLAGAVQYCGFRSVVGTMWEMADDDGPDLAGNFYRSVFSNRWEGITYYERTAESLRDAVKVLRRKRNMSLERWVNFVHYGA